MAVWLLLPGIHSLAEFLYAWVTRNRYHSNRELCEDSARALHVDHPSTPNITSAERHGAPIQFARVAAPV